MTPALTPLLEVITDLTRRLAVFDRELATLITAHHPVAQRVRQPAGVGPLTALA